MIKRLKTIYFCILTFFIIIFIFSYVSLKHYFIGIIPEENHEIQNYYFSYISNFSVGGNPNTSNLFDITDFTFVIKPKATFCYDIKADHTILKAVFIVTSHISNVETRSAMRRAFSEDDLRQLGVRRVFLLGITQDSKFINQNAVEDEARKYGDIVQGNFNEAYRNLTYKHVMGLMWVNRYCGETQFVIKMDDDIVINLLKLLELLKKFDYKEDFISGYVLRDLQVKRIRANKWFVTQEEYPRATYPKFVSGWLYITTPSVCDKLLQLAKKEKYFWIDDVFLTGILAEKIPVKMYDIKEYFTDHPEYFQCCLNDHKKQKLDCDIVVGPNGGRTNLFYEFNEVFRFCIGGKCNERLYKMNDTCIKRAKTTNLGRGNAIVSSYKLVR